MDGENVRDGYIFRGRSDQRDIGGRDMRDNLHDRRQRER